MEIQPEIMAEITLFSSQKGGRLSAIPSGEYRAVLSVDKLSFSARLNIESSEGLNLGQIQSLGVQFLIPNDALPHFPVGTHFTLWEGKDIGSGIVMAICKSRK